MNTLWRGNSCPKSKVACCKGWLPWDQIYLWYFWSSVLTPFLAAAVPWTMEKYIVEECTLQQLVPLYDSIQSGGQKMPSLKADYCLTLMSILVDPRVKRHTSSFDWAFLCTDAPWHVVASCPHNCHMWLLTEKVNKVKVCLKGFEYATSTILPPFWMAVEEKIGSTEQLSVCYSTSFFNAVHVHRGDELVYNVFFTTWYFWVSRSRSPVKSLKTKYFNQWMVNGLGQARVALVCLTVSTRQGQVRHSLTYVAAFKSSYFSSSIQHS